jgi:ribokinase
MSGLDILCCGELVVDEISRAEKITDDQASVKLTSTGHYYGGRGGNFSVYSSMFGLRVGIVGGMGNDPEGLEYRSYLASRGIETSTIFRNAKAHTSKCFFFIEGDKSRIFFYDGALQDERESYLSNVKDAAAGIAHSAIYCTSADGEVNRVALLNSKAETKIYGPSSTIYLHSKEGTAECLSNTDVLFLNRNESEFVEGLLKKGLEEIMDEFGIKLLIRTLGGDGSQIITAQGRVDIPPCKPARVVDTTGAGDAFAGAFVANYLKTKDPAYSGRIASAVASFVVEEIGCQTNIPTMEKIMQRANESSTR